MSEELETPSSRLQAYLDKYPRSDSSDTWERIEEQFSAANLPCFQRVVYTFFHFGGYYLPGPHGTFRIYRAKRAIAAGWNFVRRSQDPDYFRIPFGADRTTQAWFLMDGLGQLYLDETRDAESIEQWIERYSK